MNDSSAQPGPVLVMVRGIPGSGKSFLAGELEKRFGVDSTVLLDPDLTDYSSEAYRAFSAALTAEGVDEKLHPYRYLRAQAYAAAPQRKIIIWNQAFTNQDILDRTIKNLQANAEEHGMELPALIVEVNIDPRIAKERVVQREAAGGHGVPEENFERFINDYSTFAAYGYPLVTVDGGDIADGAAAVAKEIERLR